MTPSIQAANAFMPWTHATDFFCKCPQCHRARIARVENICHVLWSGLNKLEWPVPATTLTPSTFASSDKTFVGKIPQSGDRHGTK